MTGVEVAELHTQDGWDWPNGCADERWPADKYQPAAPYFREQMRESMSAVSPDMLREKFNRKHSDAPAPFFRRHPFGAQQRRE